MKSTLPKHSGAKRKTKTKAKRVNITLPDGLYTEAMKHAEKYHYEGFSDLVQDLLRNEVFKDPAMRAILLNESTHPKSHDDSEGN